jgi:CTP synthase
MFCNVQPGHVFEAIDVPHIYEVPLRFAEQKMDEVILKQLKLPVTPLKNQPWVKMVESIKSATERLTIGVVGKYIELQDAYKSIYQSLHHGAEANQLILDIKRIDSETLTPENVDERLDGLAGILIPGGFGIRGIEGKIQAARFARENEIPFFGICLGMQCAVIEFARNVAGMENANSSEFNADTPFPVIDLLATQKTITSLGGTMRLGSYSCRMIPGTKAQKAYGVDQIAERHRHRYEFNNKYREELIEKGLRVAGTTMDTKLVEIVELPDHPWFIGCQFHPEFKSRPLKPHPLFREFIRAAKEVGAKQTAGAKKKKK